ncbi:MAG TPA: transaldolase [Candidatus Competibacteraceae bacterium]|nr:MAG: transaldolase [Candidatus Competibacteraceae bacterium]RUQ41492.1 MAG: transaldolase [Candidatus Competibacteraceae bacterium]HNW77296.1 transaldolase [Candidatus Competibacteraceae bacterium]HQC71752.1 transaldolase [Candidatus Competibacteraceae bacterium]
MPHANPLRLLSAAGQSVWYDNIQRSMLRDGTLARLIAEDDLRGITSNPTIFEKAIAGSADYDEALRQELRRNPEQSSRELFFSLAIEDIRAAAEALRPTYEASAGVDGMVSLEVAPDLAHDLEGTVREARALVARLDLPNVMIKVPGTVTGLHAVERLIAAGINVNVTLLFSVERYVSVAEAYLRGLERRRALGLPLDRVASVASFFISRIDTLLDPLLAERQPELQGQIAIANAQLAYQEYQEIFGSAHFAALRAAGARPQRLLWASTSTKNPAYPDLLYVDRLIGPDTVNTMPPATYAAFRDHGTIAPTLEQDVETALARLAALPALGIDLGAITDQLEIDGINAFIHSFDTLLAALDAKRAVLA